MPGIILLQALNARQVYRPGDTSITVPDGTSYVRLWVQAAGGGGKGRAYVDGAAGGGGGFAYLERAVLSGEWLSTLTIAVGAGVAGTAGGNTTLSGTLNGAAVSVTANGGGAGTAFVDGSGGSASGGDTNISGTSGFGYVATPPDERFPGTPGEAGGSGFAGALDAPFQAPGDGGFASSVDTAGFGGYIIAEKTIKTAKTKLEEPERLSTLPVVRTKWSESIKKRS